MRKTSGSKIVLTKYEEMLGAPEEESSVDVELDKIRDFKNHPFHVNDDEKMDELVKSISENGVLTPVLIRPVGEGYFEMISGHRRKHAATLAGLTKIPAIIREMPNTDIVENSCLM